MKQGGVSTHTMENISTGAAPFDEVNFHAVSDVQPEFPAVQALQGPSQGPSQALVLQWSTLAPLPILVCAAVFLTVCRRYFHIKQ